MSETPLARRPHGHRRLLWLVVLIVGLGAFSAAQAQEDPAPTVDPLQKLEALLNELKQTDPKAWDAKVVSLQQAIEQKKAQAQQLREQAKQLEAQAARAEQEALAIAGSIERLQKLRQLIEPMGAPPKAAPKGEKPAPAMAPQEASGGAKPASAAAAPKMMAASKPSEGAAAETEKVVLNFEDHVLTIFESHCVGCHNPDDLAGSLDLTSHTTLLDGGGSGAVVAPGDPEGSRLYRLVAHLDTPTMPPEQSKIPDEQIATLRAWLAQGAAADAGAAQKAAEMTVAKPVAPVGPVAPRLEGPPPMPEDVAGADLKTARRPPIAGCLAASPRAPLIAVPGLEQVLLYHSESLVLLTVLPFPLGRVNVLRFTVDGTRLLAAGGIGGRKGGAVLYDVRSGQIVAEVGKEYDEVLAAAISPGQSLIAIGGPSRKVRVFETASGELRYQLDAHQDWVLSVDISPDGNWLASADRSGVAFVWQADTGRDVHVLRGHTGAIQRARFRPDAQQLATVSDDGTIRRWELGDGKMVGNTNAHGGGVLGFCWRGTEWASCGADGAVKLWDAAGNGQGALPPLEDWLYAVATDASGGRLFVGGWDGRVRVYASDTRQPIGELGVPSSL